MQLLSYKGLQKGSKPRTFLLWGNTRYLPGETPWIIVFCYFDFILEIHQKYLLTFSKLPFESKHGLYIQMCCLYAYINRSQPHFQKLSQTYKMSFCSKELWLSQTCCKSMSTFWNVPLCQKRLISPKRPKPKVSDLNSSSKGTNTNNVTLIHLNICPTGFWF